MSMCSHTQDPTRSGRVLVVDGEDHVRQAIRTILTNAGYDVVDAADGVAAMEILRGDGSLLMVDIITCDIGAPRVNGVEAVEFFRQQFPSTPVLLLTGYPDTLLAVSLLQDGVVDYVTKPIEGEKLIRVVEQAMMYRTAFKD
jgi:two-component system chemotaxis response regulator CheY